MEVRWFDHDQIEVVDSDGKVAYLHLYHDRDFSHEVELADLVVSGEGDDPSEIDIHDLPHEEIEDRIRERFPNVRELRYYDVSTPSQPRFARRVEK